MIDLRLKVLERKLEKVENVVMVGSGKGGVGKSIFSSAISYTLSKKGYDVAYVDLDFYGPAAPNLFPIERPMKGGRDGLELPTSNGVKVVSIGYLLDGPLPLKGKDKVDLLIDLLSTLNLGSLNFMILDLPPGLGDEFTFTKRLFQDRVKIVLVTLNSEMSLNVVEKLAKYVKIEKLNLLGIVVNMADLFKEYRLDQLKSRLNGEILGTISYHSKLDYFRSIEEKLKNLPDFAREINSITERILNLLNSTCST
ncbi:MAG: P-loop NTPase [Archaeoglobaceae archaeon]|nr:P-loop NTPase [Archaeoglobaceae archaeon]MCX8152410.1 P-loop NTPase [Archaeoglobaceae archaeon]MDW8013750.1 P-loop NTPase [Archaeoglobaceae archaeon]